MNPDFYRQEQNQESQAATMATEEHIKLNKANWDERAPEHAASSHYGFEKFISDPSYLSDVVTFDIPLLGDISNLDVVHLQCHIGTDTLSLARRGAKSVVGLDFSPPALKEAERLASSTTGTGGEKLSFVEASMYDALTVLQAASFDLVFTGIGALCWLPSISLWAKTVSSLLKPGGKLFIREAHPIFWAANEYKDNAGGPVLGWPYFEREEPMIWNQDGTYVDIGDKKFKNTGTAEWNHGMGEIIQALIDNGMQITGLVDHKSVPYNGLPGQMEQSGPHGEWVMKEHKDSIPLTYTLQAVKK